MKLFNWQILFKDTKLRRTQNMRAIALIVIMSLLIFWGCTTAEEYIKIEDYETGMTYSVSKSALDWFNKGNQLYTKGSYESAIMCFDKAIELDSSYDSPWINKGYCLKFLGRYDEALKAFDKATTLNPLSSGAWNEKGELLQDQGKYDEAIKAYNISIELDPDYAYTWMNKGIILGRKGMYQEAIKCFDEAIECYDADHMKKPKHMSDPKGAKIAWYNKGIALEALGDDNEANAAFAKAKELGYTG
jgi:tetratricopeptide (TPR) repeat protein